MPGLFKPLFSPNLLARRLTGFAPTPTPEITGIADQWSRTAADPAFLNLNEKPLQGQFLSDIFARLLGYAPAVGHLDAYHLKPESASSETKGVRTPDARLVAIESEIDDRVYRLFNLTAADRRLLAEHSRHAMIDYPYGAV